MPKFNFGDLLEKDPVVPIKKPTKTSIKVAKRTDLATLKKSKVQSSPKKKISKKSMATAFSKTIDLDRGVYRLLTNENDKDMSKTEIEHTIKNEMANPKSMARLLRNLATYLES